LIHCCILLALLGHSALASAPRQRDLLMALAIVPVLRLLSLSMPLSDYRQVYWYVIVGVPLMAATWLAVRMLRLRREDIGLAPGRLPQQLLISLTGLVFGMGEYFILRPDPLVDTLTLQDALLPALILLVMTGLAEELLFRGVLQRVCLRALPRWAVVYVALLFAVLHMGHHSVLDLFFVLVVGLFFGWVVSRTGSILGTTVSHGITNVMLFIIIPLSALGPGPTPDSAALPPVQITSLEPSPAPALALASATVTATTTAPVPTPETDTEPTTYMVASGDTLWDIAQRFGTTAEVLRALNGLATESIHEGQTLLLPGASSPIPVEPSPTPATARSYTVQSGDTLFSIARAHGVDVPTLMEMNGLETEDIQAGQMLQVP
jgi:LysM repeat protein